MINKIFCVIVLFYTCLLFNSCVSGDKLRYRSAFLNHYSTVIESVKDDYGTEVTSMWLASWNLNTKQKICKRLFGTVHRKKWNHSLGQPLLL